MAKLEFLIIHCTDTPAGREITSAVIRQWHLEERGWKQVGYSEMVHINGGIETLVNNNNDDLVDPWEITNGAVGMNAKSRHIVYVGGKGGDTRTTAQKGAMMAFVRDFVKKHPQVRVAGHNQFAAKACPSFDVPQWLRIIGIPEKNIYKA